MKYFNKTKMTSLLLVFACLFISNKLLAQCPMGNVVLTTQAEVNAFGANYPNCKQITGNLDIGVNSGTTDITNLSPLSNINSVTGNLYINNTQKLISLEPLNKIISVGKNFQIYGNTKLTTVNFPNLTSLNGILNIDNNPSLINIDGFNNIKYVKGYLQISNNPLLTNLDSLSDLKSIGQDIYIADNAILNNVSGLKNTTFQPYNGYGLTIKNNPALAVCNLPNFCSYLANPASTHPRSISGNLANCINEQAVLVACIATNCPQGDVTLTTQSEVNAFGANYPNCAKVFGNLNIGVNTGTSDITNLSPLSKINSVTGELIINNNQKLTSIEPLNKINSVGKNIQLYGNTKLTTVNFPSLTSIDDFLNIVNNPSLTNIDGFNNIKYVKGFVQISNNPSLTNIDGLIRLSSIGEFLAIADNDVLTNLDSLSELKSIGQDIYIVDNAILNNVTGLKNTTFQPFNGYGLTIKDNPALAVCNLPNFCSFLSNPANTHSRVISGNLANCVNEAAVVLACMNVAVNDIDRSNISVYPNPIKSIINFSEEVSNIKITDLSGRMLMKYSDYTKSVNVENLIDGIYIIEATTNSGKLLTRKFVKSIQ